MRISDWSSDVCSSVLVRRPASYVFAGQADAALAPTHDSGNGFHGCAFTGAIATQQCQCFDFMHGKGKHRKRVVLGKSVSVSVDLCGRRIIKKKKKKT